VSSLLIFATPIAGLKVVERSSRGDRRGFLARLFCADELADAGWCKPVAQVNQTFTKGKPDVYENGGDRSWPALPASAAG